MLFSVPAAPDLVEWSVGVDGGAIARWQLAGMWSGLRATNFNAVGGDAATAVAAAVVVLLQLLLLLLLLPLVFSTPH